MSSVEKAAEAIVKEFRGLLNECHQQVLAEKISQHCVGRDEVGELVRSAKCVDDVMAGLTGQVALDHEDSNLVQVARQLRFDLQQALKEIQPTHGGSDGE